MGFYQFDSSGILKRYVAEVGSEWVTAICDPASGHVIGLSCLVQAEVCSALCRRCREGSLTQDERDRLMDGFLYDCQTQYRMTRVTDPLLLRTVDLMKRHPLRAYDTVQLATAGEVNERLQLAGLPPLIFVSADDQLLAAAQTEGLSTENPNLHP